ncbi:hypothetical protein D3C71_1399450 [compost metagenome]
MIAIGGAGESHGARDRLDVRRVKFGYIDMSRQSFGGLFENKPYNGIATTKCLEAAKAETETLIFHVDARHPERGGEPWKRHQRGGSIVFAVGEVSFDLPGCVFAERLDITRIKMRFVVRKYVWQKHDWLRFTSRKHIALDAH